MIFRIATVFLLLERFTPVLPEPITCFDDDECPNDFDVCLKERDCQECEGICDTSLYYASVAYYGKYYENHEYGYYGDIDFDILPELISCGDPDDCPNDSDVCLTKPYCRACEGTCVSENYQDYISYYYYDNKYYDGGFVPEFNSCSDDLPCKNENEVCLTPEADCFGEECEGICVINGPFEYATITTVIREPNIGRPDESQFGACVCPMFACASPCFDFLGTNEPRCGVEEVCVTEPTFFDPSPGSGCDPCPSCPGFKECAPGSGGGDSGGGGSGGDSGGNVDPVIYVDPCFCPVPWCIDPCFDFSPQLNTYDSYYGSPPEPRCGVEEVCVTEPIFFDSNPGSGCDPCPGCAAFKECSVSGSGGGDSGGSDESGGNSIIPSRRGAPGDIGRDRSGVRSDGGDDSNGRDVGTNDSSGRGGPSPGRDFVGGRGGGPGGGTTSRGFNSDSGAGGGRGVQVNTPPVIRRNGNLRA